MDYFTAVNSYPKLCLMLDSSLDRKTIDKFYQAKKKHKINVDIYFNLSNEEVLNFYKKTKALVGHLSIVFWYANIRGILYRHSNCRRKLRIY